MPDFKVCKICGERKPLSDFYAMKGMRDGHRLECKVCNLAEKKRRYDADPQAEVARVKRWQQANADRLNAGRRKNRERPDVKRRERDSYYRRKHGISVDEADAILEAQNNRCAICKREAPERLASMHLDHDHRTGRIRGFLCIDCNHGLGKFRDEPDLLLRALVYLREGGFIDLVDD